jgi:ribonucleoside-diphosphate reductase alpha chain
MRAMMSAGPALEKCNIAGYNCAYVPIEHPHAFDEVLYILMNGTGVGFSVEPQCVQQLPVVAERFSQTSSTLVVEDSREGWARALRELIALLYSGQVCEQQVD